MFMNINLLGWPGASWAGDPCFFVKLLKIADFGVSKNLPGMWRFSCFENLLCQVEFVFYHQF